ncbi:MAG: bifunctional DNA primase/polymerase, partial [Clostridium sp.]
MEEREKSLFYEKYKLFPLFKVRYKSEGKKKEVKTPLTLGSWKKKENQIFSLKEFKDHPAWGLVCGEKSNIMVLDIDGDIDLLDDLLKAANLDDRDIEIVKNTLIVKTPRGGYHFYFKYLKGLKNSASKFYKNCDFRTDGGYVLAPFSEIINDEGIKVSYIPITPNATIEDMPIKLFNFIKGAKNKKEIDEFVAFDEDTFSGLKGMVEGDGRNVALNEALFKHCTKHHIRDITTIRLLALAVNEKYFGEPEEGFLKTADSVYKAVNDGNNDFSPISEYNGCYFKSIRNGSIPISNFIIKPIRFIECIDDNKKSILEAILITQEDEKIYKEYRATDFDNVQTFDKVTCDFRTRYIGNVQDLKYIKTMVFNQVEKRIRGVNCGGMHLINEEWYFVDNNGCI